MNEARVAEMIKKELGVENVRFITTHKNNKDLSGCVIGDSVVNPTLYYNPADTDEKIVKTIVKTYRNAGVPDDEIASFDLNKIYQREYIFPRVYPQIVKRENNDAFLQDNAKTDVLDLTVIYRVRINDNASMVLPQVAVDHSDYSVEELHEVAVKNMMQESRVCSMAQVMAEIMGVDESMIGDDNGMMIISNDRKMYGASVAFLNENVLFNLSKRFGDDVVIIPSSIHECIAIPATGADAGVVNAMICDVNNTEVKVEEQLTDHAYIYHIATAKIEKFAA